jgi:hypothetical protein
MWYGTMAHIAQDILLSHNFLVNDQLVLWSDKFGCHWHRDKLGLLWASDHGGSESLFPPSGPPCTEMAP